MRHIPPIVVVYVWFCETYKRVVRQCKKPDPQMAHLVFPDTRANAQKTKRAIFCQHTDRQTDNKK